MHHQLLRRAAPWLSLDRASPPAKREECLTFVVRFARRLAELGIPILQTVRGQGPLEGADAAWLDGGTVLLATGLHTNAEDAAQITALLREMNEGILRSASITYHPIEVDELVKAAGGIGCLTGILEREPDI